MNFIYCEKKFVKFSRGRLLLAIFLAIFLESSHVRLLDKTHIISMIQIPFFCFRAHKVIHRNSQNPGVQNMANSFYDHMLVGDDFFLALVTAEMGMKYVKSKYSKFNH